MNAAVLREELQGYIAVMPERKLEMLKPFLAEFAKPAYIIEPASPEECAMVEERVREYHADPSSFVSLKSRKNRCQA